MRQLQADSVSEVRAKLVDVTRLPEANGSHSPRKVEAGNEGAALGFTSFWEQKLHKEKLVMQKRKQKLKETMQKEARKNQLRVEPQLLDKQLARWLQHWEHGTPRSPWEKQLAQLLQEAPKRLSCKEEHYKAGRLSKMRYEGRQQKLLAFLECCVLVDQLPLAHHVLVKHHSKPRQQQALTLPMYNTVLLGWARKVSGARWARENRVTTCHRWR